MEPQQSSPPESKIYQYMIVGKMDTLDVCIPFTTVAEISQYLESVDWAMRKLRADIDIKIYQAGVQVGVVKTPAETLLTH